MGKEKKIMIAAVLFVTASGIFYSVSYGKKEEAVFLAEETMAPDGEGKALEPGEEDLDGESKAGQPPSGVIYAHICGQVLEPGVYCLEETARVADLVELAGGFTEEAARDFANLAEKLADGQKVYIPSVTEAEEGGLGGQAAQETGAGKININTASQAELMELSGIGEAKAAAIVKYRQEHGKFASIEDLKKIEGIKEGIFNKIKDEITIN